MLFLLVYFMGFSLSIILRRHVELLNRNLLDEMAFFREAIHRVSQETLHLVLWPVRVNRISRVHIPRYWCSLHSGRSDSTCRGRSARAQASARHTSRGDPWRRRCSDTSPSRPRTCTWRGPAGDLGFPDTPECPAPPEDEEEGGRPG